jgi:ATP-dependent DNA helicase RecQ
LRVIAAHCEAKGLPLNAGVAPTLFPAPPAEPKRTARTDELNALFRGGQSVEGVMQRTGLARSTVCDYLTAFVKLERPESVAAWVDEATYQRVAEAARQVGVERLKPIFLALNEKVPYDAIRLVLAHLTAGGGEPRTQ